MEFRILGPLEVLAEGRAVALGGSKQRALLAVLLLHANEALTTDRLIEALWGEGAPPTAAKAVYVHVSRLRKALAACTADGGAGDGLLVTRERGYELRLDRERLDSNCFERMVAEGRGELAEGRPRRALETLEEALSLWRGEPLADLAYEPFAQAEIARLADLRVGALELLVEAKLALGRHAEVISQLEALIGEHPYRERLRAQLMLALYRSDRQADALGAYQDARRALVEELGIEPGERLRELERAILAQEPTLAAPGAPLAVGEGWPDAGGGAALVPVAEGLPTGVVTFLLTDIEGSSRLWERDAEGMAAALELHDELIQGSVNAHGGRLLKAKGEGDATLSVFRRASDAAACGVDCQRALLGATWPGGLDLRVRMALHTGEAHEREGDYFGPALNRAARLRSLARGRSTLISQATAEIVQDRLPTDVELVDLGRQELRGLTRPENVFELRATLSRQSGPEASATPADTRPAPPTRGVGRAVLGRLDELDAIESFLARAGRQPAALVFSGEPGIGKTILWEAAVNRARGRGDCVLQCRGAEAEATLSFAALSDLLVDVLEEALPSILPPRRRALEVALLLEEPAATALDPRAVGIAFLDVLRLVAESRQVVVAVDDLQWIDAASAGVLQFALRRLRDERVGFLATVRLAAGASIPVEFERSFPEGALRLSLGPVSLGVLHHLLRDRLGLELARPELVRVHEVTGGNPFFALELGRELEHAKAGAAPGRPLPIPSALKKLLGGRLARLPGETRDVLLTASAMARPSAEVLAAAHGDSESTIQALERAAREGVVELDESGVRFVHPLLASVCYQDAPLWRRRAAHGRIASVVADVEERARHLALAADRPDAAVASVLDTAAEASAARGATASAAELCELAVDLTPKSAANERRRRGLAAAHFHRLSGNRERAGRILAALLDEVPTGAQRADVLLALALGRRGDLPAITKLCDAALDEASGDDVRSAQVMAFLSWISLLEGKVRGALRHARAGLEKAERVRDPMLLARAIARVAMAETWALEISPGLVERGVAIEEALAWPLEFHESPKIALARRLICMGDLEPARALLEQAEAQASSRGDEGTRGHVLFHVVVLEVFAGRFKRALSHAGAALELAEQLGDEQYRGMALYATAWVEAHLGGVEPARAAAERAAAIAERVSDTIFPIWIAAALGHLELSLGDLQAADRHLRQLPARLVALGWNDPTDELWPDAIEALVGLGEVGEARSYLEQYEQLARRSGSPWALAVAARCRGLVAAGEGDFPAAFTAFEHALAQDERLESRFERGRLLQALGSVRRRARQKRAAREALEEALEIFDQAGAKLWAQKARDELGRISGRRAAAGRLTETEERVAALAARGLSNKDIAGALFVSVHTVEAHLSRIYRKLGVRSRADLARRLAAPDQGDAAAKV